MGGTCTEKCGAQQGGHRQQAHFTALLDYVGHVSVPEADGLARKCGARLYAIASSGSRNDGQRDQL
jgi:hypothetical protein